MLKKQSAKKVAQPDFSTLDAAVNELSKQTAALLGDDGENLKTAPKPTLPKKHISPAKKGKSFDIIHSPKAKLRIAAKLKTATSTPSLEAGVEEHTLLPDHAGISFNEEPANQHSPAKKMTTSSEEEPKKATSPAVIINHHGTTLRSNETVNSVVSTEGVSLETDEASDVPTNNEPTAVSHTALAFGPKEKESTPNANSSKDEEAAEKTSNHSEQTETVTKNTEKSDTKDQSFNKSTEGGELYANNLVSPTIKKSYEPPEDQQKPTVFDTNEYHPELHDWSKLGKGQGYKWVVLSLLIAIAGVLAYMYISGTLLSF